MKNFAITTLTVVTLTMFAGDARAQGGFFSSLFGLSPRPASNTSYYGTTYPASNSSSYGTYPATNCSNGVCTTTQYGPTWNNSGYYSASTGNGYSNTYPTYYAPGTNNTGAWTTTPSVLPASYSNCPGGYCPTTPATRPTTPYQTTPYTPVNYTAPSYHTPQYNTPTYNNGPYYNSY